MSAPKFEPKVGQEVWFENPYVGPVLHGKVTKIQLSECFILVDNFTFKQWVKPFHKVFPTKEALLKSLENGN